jgi:hypothetical protein
VLKAHRVAPASAIFDLLPSPLSRVVPHLETTTPRSFPFPFPLSPHDSSKPREGLSQLRIKWEFSMNSSWFPNTWWILINCYESWTYKKTSSGPGFHAT